MEKQSNETRTCSTRARSRRSPILKHLYNQLISYNQRRFVRKIVSCFLKQVKTPREAASAHVLVRVKQLSFQLSFAAAATRVNLQKFSSLSSTAFLLTYTLISKNICSKLLCLWGDCIQQE